MYDTVQLAPIRFGRMGHGQWVAMGKFDWGVRYVIIFLYVQFWIRLATVSYRGENVRTVVSPAVRSVNRSGDTRNFVQNGPQYAICVIFTTRLYYKATGNRKMSALSTASAMVTTHENSVMMWSFEGAKLFSVL